MYLRPDEVAKVLENTGFERDYVTDQAYGYRKGAHYVYVNREARMGRTALVIHPALKERSVHFATPTSPVRTSEQYLEFPRFKRRRPEPALRHRTRLQLARSAVALPLQHVPVIGPRIGGRDQPWANASRLKRSL